MNQIKKINEKYITNLRVKCKTIKLLEDNIDYRGDSGLDNVFLDITANSQSLIDEMVFY